MENQNPYTVHSGDEFNGDERYSVLRGPEEWECWLTELEDRSWVRDGKEVVNKLNAYHRENAQLKAEVTQLNGILRHAGWGQGEIDSAAYTEETIAQLRADLEQAREFTQQLRTKIRERAERGEETSEDKELVADMIFLLYQGDLKKMSQAKAREARLREALRALHALVKGECPSLLREDSGGDAVLDCAIEAVLKEAGT